MTKNNNLQTIDELKIEQQREILERMSDSWNRSGFDPDSLLDEFELSFFDKNVLYENTTSPAGTFNTQTLNYVINLKMKDSQLLLKTLYKSYQGIFGTQRKNFNLRI